MDIKHLEYERQRFNRYGWSKEQAELEGWSIMEYINTLSPHKQILFRVNPGTLEVITWDNDKYIDYDFYPLYPHKKNGAIGSGYYWRCRLQKDDDRIGKRKLYRSSKGLYFIESDIRHYLNEYIRR